MPYVKQEQRPGLDVIVDLMVEKGIKANGDLNYVLYKFCKYHVECRYNALKNFCGELRQCATEIERTILGPYEDLKEKENGPIE